MNPTDALQYKEILATIQGWPADLRFTLLQDLLHSFAPENKQTSPQPTWQRALGLLEGPHQVPSDAEVAQWLEEHRLEKFA